MKRVGMGICVLSYLVVFFGTACPAKAAAVGDLAEPPRELKTYLRFFSQEILKQGSALFDPKDLGTKYIHPEFDVTLYEISYWTTGIEDLDLPREKRQLVRASGMLILPLKAGKVPLLSYQHGTTTSKKLTSSYPSFVETIAMAVLFAGNGYAVSAPDYLGLGKNTTQIHPYLHAESEATASADMIIAAENAIKFLAKNPRNPRVSLTRQLFLAGYSQGGHATMALHRYLEQDTPNKDFDIMGVAPMAGPFDLTGKTLNAILKKAVPDHVTFMRYLLLGLNPIYHFFSDRKEVFKSSLVDTVSKEFDGSIAAGEDAPDMPDTLEGLLNPEFLTALKSNPASNPAASKLIDVLRKNTLYEWVPRAPVLFIHSKGDEIVPFDNSKDAYHYMSDRGAKVALIPLAETIGHGHGAGVAIPKLLSWFDSLRAKK